MRTARQYSPQIEVYFSFDDMVLNQIASRKEEDQRESTASPDIFSSSHEDQEQLPSAMVCNDKK